MRLECRGPLGFRQVIQEIIGVQVVTPCGIHSLQDFRIERVAIHRGGDQLQHRAWRVARNACVGQFRKRLQIGFGCGANYDAEGFPALPQTSPQGVKQSAILCRAQLVVNPERRR